MEGKMSLKSQRIFTANNLRELHGKKNAQPIFHRYVRSLGGRRRLTGANPAYDRWCNKIAGFLWEVKKLCKISSGQRCEMMMRGCKKKDLNNRPQYNRVQVETDTREREKI